MPFLPANAHADAKTRIGRAAVQLTATAGLSTTVLEETSMVARMITSGPPYPRHRGRLETRLQGFAQIAPLSAVDILVTDASPAEELCRTLREASVEVLVAPT